MGGLPIESNLGRVQQHLHSYTLSLLGSESHLGNKTLSLFDRDAHSAILSLYIDLSVRVLDLVVRNFAQNWPPLNIING